MRPLIRVISLFFALLIAPALGLGVANYVIGANQDYLSIGIKGFQEEITTAIDDLQASNSHVKETQFGVYELFVNANSEHEDYKSYLTHINDIIASSVSQKEQSDIVLEQVLSNLLGDPIASHQGANSAIKIYTLDGVDYRGYMAKITPYNSKALNIVLADNCLYSNGERTSDAAVRTGGILGVNAGGFMSVTGGKLQPLGTTVVDGQVVQFAKDEALTFVGFDYSGKLVAKNYKSEAEIRADGIRQGASFSPSLLENGEKLPIPAKWANSKHPRTIIGSFSNDDILVIVIDGRRTGWSNGVTLEEVQDKLLSFKIKNAYNLDGGGSSVFYYDGKILNKPSGGTERLVTTNLVVLP